MDGLFPRIPVDSEDMASAPTRRTRNIKETTDLDTLCPIMSWRAQKDCSPTRPAKRQKTARENPFDALRRVLPQAPSTRTQRASSSATYGYRRKVSQRSAAENTSMEVEDVSDSDVDIEIPPALTEDEVNALARATFRNPTKVVSNPIVVTAQTPHQAGTPTLSPSHPASRSTTRTSKVVPSLASAPATSHSAQTPLAPTFEHSVAPAIPSREHAAVSASQPQHSPEASHNAENNVTSPISVATVKTLLDLRKSALEVLTEDQLLELRVESIRMLLGRTIAGVIAGENVGL